MNQYSLPVQKKNKLKSKQEEGAGDFMVPTLGRATVAHKTVPMFGHFG